MAILVIGNESHVIGVMRIKSDLFSISGENERAFQYFSDIFITYFPEDKLVIGCESHDFGIIPLKNIPFSLSAGNGHGSVFFIHGIFT